MYAYIRGTLDSIGNDNAVVEAHGVGYRIYAPLSTISELPRPGAEVKLYTSYIVREDVNMLCGFLTSEELYMFEILMTVSGVGVRVALSVLSAISPAKFGFAVMSEDYKTLTCARGVGAKLAQKICFELRDKMKKEHFQITGDDNFGTDKSGLHGFSEMGKMSEAVSALTILGYSYHDANKAVSAIYSSELGLEDTIKEALRHLGRQ